MIIKRLVVFVGNEIQTNVALNRVQCVFPR